MPEMVIRVCLCSSPQCFLAAVGSETAGLLVGRTVVALGSGDMQKK